MQTIDFQALAPAGYRVALVQVFDDASSIVLQLDCGGARVCGSLVAGRWAFHVPQNKRGTARMSRQQHAAIKAFAQAVQAKAGADWMARHAAMYA